MFVAPQRDGDLGPSYLDPIHISRDKLRIVDGRIATDMLADRIHNDSLDLCSGHAGDGPGDPRLALDQGGGDVIAIPRTALATVARAHAVAAVIDAAHQQSFRVRSNGLISVVLLGEL